MNTATAEARKFLTATTHYKVHFGTRLHSHAPPHFEFRIETMLCLWVGNPNPFRDPCGSALSDSGARGCRNYY